MNSNKMEDIMVKEMERRYFRGLGGDSVSVPSGSDRGERIEGFFAENGVSLRVDGVERGPVVTKYVVSLGSDRDHVARVENLRRDLGIRLGVGAGRVYIGETPWKGGVSLAIEVPNAERAGVPAGAVIPSVSGDIARDGLRVCLGVDTSGRPYSVDLSVAPHVLVAGQSGSGKSVFLDSLICGLLDNYGLGDCEVSVVDPKGTEFISFSGHPGVVRYGLGIPEEGAVVRSEEAAEHLEALVRVMRSRMAAFAGVGAGNIREYREVTGSAMPYHVAVVDEFYDLLVNYPEAEGPMGILAAKARSAGIHLVLATQRPSADVVRGALKANLSTRIALKVASRTDSQVILDRGGAETLCGRGDMLYMGPDGDAPVRLHGCYVSNADIRGFVASCAGR